MSISNDSVVCRKISLVLISAKDVEETRTIFKSKLYASVSIGDDEATIKRTPTDKQNQTNPEWNHKFEYHMTETDIQDPSGHELLIELFLNRTRGDKRVSYMRRNSINELFNLGANNMREGCYSIITLPLLNDGGESKGEITFKYMFGELVSLKKLSLLEKCVNAGVSLAIKTALVSTIGIYAPIPIRIFSDPEIVCSSTGGAILGEESLIDILFEGAQFI